MTYRSLESPLLKPSPTAGSASPYLYSPRLSDSSDEANFNFSSSKHLQPRKLRRHVFAALALILCAATFTTIYQPSTSERWSSAVRYAKSFSSHQAESIPEDHHVVWATDTRITEEARFPAPVQKYRLNFLHGLVRSVEDTYKHSDFPTSHYVHLLTLIDETPLQRHNHPMWQTYQASNLSEVIQDVLCVFSFGDAHSVSHATRQIHRTYPYPDIQMASLLYCPIPELFKKIMDERGEEAAMQNKDTSFFFSKPKEFVRLTLQFNFHDTDDSHYHNIKLYPQVLPKQPPKSSMAMCLAPIFALDENVAELSLQWREHHRLLGVQTVHWYARSPEWAARIQHYNQIQGTKDTFRLANRISPESRGGDILEVKGEYADQVLYMLDCMLRSLSSSPAEWLAFSDLDEFWMPSPATPQGMSDYLASRSEFVGATCQSRTHVSGDPISLARNESQKSEGMKKKHKSTILDLKLASFDHVRNPQKYDGYDNYKCIYRPESVEMAIVHEPVSFLHEAMHAQRQSEDGDIQLIHMGSHKAFGKGPWKDKFEPKPDYIEHLKKLSKSRNRVKAKMSEPLPKEEEEFSMRVLESIS